MFTKQQKMWVKTMDGKCSEVLFSRAAMKNVMMSSAINLCKTKNMASKFETKFSLREFFYRLVNPRYSF